MQNINNQTAPSGGVEHFADGSSILTDGATGNCTVIGAMAHAAYFQRLREARFNSSGPDVAVVAYCMNRDGTRKAELIRRRNSNPITREQFGEWGWEVWEDSEPGMVRRFASEAPARSAFHAAMMHGTSV